MPVAQLKSPAQELDAADPLKSFRSEFILPQHNGSDAIYFLGNSLGLQPKRTGAYVQRVMDQWSAHGVESFFRGHDPWLKIHRQLLPILSQIVGARPEEIVVMNSLTVNLHLLMVSFYQPHGRRTKILCEAKAFPSDQYAFHSHVRQRGLHPEEVIIEVQPRAGEEIIRHEDIIAAIDQHGNSLALVLWGGVNYYSGQLFNMQAITEAAQAVGAKVGFDLAHAAGNVALQLHNWNVDFACWCSYKYLNSGPGAVGGAFVHERYHNDDTLHRFAGWWGNKQETQFLMGPRFEPQPSAEGWQLSTPSPVLYAAHKAALDVVAEAGVNEVFEKNRTLNDYLWQTLANVQASVPGGTLRIITPEPSAERGCQVSMAVSNGKQVFEALAADGIYADWREPSVIRIAPVGLYNTYGEVYRFGEILQAAINAHNP